ncbi:hypothetical protein EX349_23175 [Pseudomonas protegens]|uniref:hypothetical protein n=1 Tax=Pseudomonas protegens TaxID=380021 RepID=UPI00128DEBF3|nr:hypothetical protein [Pseudomonas protegens]NAN54110.1 hypothetical protein [Pseudomonas protegens]NUE79328.1 hypothetical protein [Pseudomonas protegens]
MTLQRISRILGKGQKLFLEVGLILSKLKWIIQDLTIPTSEQVRLFSPFVNVADELALIWEDVLEGLEVF